MNAHGMNAGACLGHSASAAQQLRRGRTKGTEGRGGAWSHPVVPPAVEGRVQSARWTGPPAAPFPLSPSPVSARAKGPVPFYKTQPLGGPQGCWQPTLENRWTLCSQLGFTETSGSVLQEGQGLFPYSQDATYTCGPQCPGPLGDCAALPQGSLEDLTDLPPVSELNLRPVIVVTRPLDQGPLGIQLLSARSLEPGWVHRGLLCTGRSAGWIPAFRPPLPPAGGSSLLPAWRPLSEQKAFTRGPEEGAGKGPHPRTRPLSWGLWAL